MGRLLLVGSLVGVVAATALTAILASSPRPIYALRVSEFLSRGVPDQIVRLQGTLVRGSLCVIESPCEYRFRLRDSHRLPATATPGSPPAAELPVRYTACVVPDTFRDLPDADTELEVEGERCRGCHDFKASQIIAKCPSKYEVPSKAPVVRLPPPRCADQQRNPGRRGARTAPHAGHGVPW